MELIKSTATNCTPRSAPTLMRRIMAALQTHRSRVQLAHLTTSQLHDIGITSEMAKNEADRPIWDVPAHWLR